MNFNSSDGFSRIHCLSTKPQIHIYSTLQKEIKTINKKNRAGILIQFMSKGTAQLIA